MNEKLEDIIVAYCGLACGNCGMYRKDKCAGCHSAKPMNRNCKMKACPIEHEYIACVDCKDFENLKDCRKLNNVVSNFFGFIFSTNRIRHLRRIHEVGLEVFKEEKRQEGKA